MKFQDWYNNLQEEMNKKYNYAMILLTPSGYEIYGKRKYNYEEIRLLEETSPFPEPCITIYLTETEAGYLFVDDIPDYIMSLKQSINKLENFAEQNKKF